MIRTSIPHITGSKVQRICTLTCWIGAASSVPIADGQLRKVFAQWRRDRRAIDQER